MNPLPQEHLSARVLNAIDRGPVSADMMFDLVVGVRMRNVERLPMIHKLLTERADTLSPADFGERFGATPAQYARFVSWLRSQGLEIVRLSPSRTTVTVRGNALALNQAFGVEMHSFQDRTGVFTASVTPIAAANQVLQDLTGIIGIDNSYPWQSHLVLPPTNPVPNANAPSQTASNLETRYNATGITQPGMGQTVAILSTNTPVMTSDLNGYLGQDTPGGVSVLANGQYTQVFVGGPLRDPADSNAYVENVLDAEMVLAMAPFAKIIQVFTATNGGGLFADGIAYIVNNVPQAHVVSVSWGTCERGSASEMPILNALFAQARAEGQQWFFASGDSGSDGCRDGAGNKIMSAGWPASSPNVVGVGGTTATTTTETAWTGAGGGVSESLDKPAFQMGVTPNDSSRDEPDVAAIAGGNGVEIYSGGLTAVLGTSAATPIWAGTYAVLLQQKAAAGKGFTNALEQFYTLGKAAHGFHDITTGTQVGPSGTGTGGYSAAAGYDLVTGWGTPNLTDLIANWQ